ncbi:MAG: MEDS domain-containing protein [Deltaproteobacteria bacterium]|nr:MEDS domain-containing protein [Deltaproteobacteria bacterium]
MSTESLVTSAPQRLRKSGIDAIGAIGWGAHFCQFYQTREDLLKILVPYFKAGLESNELCVWVTSDPLTVMDAVEAMRGAVDGFDEYLVKGQIEIFPHTDWYLKGAVFVAERVLNGWKAKIEEALSRGYDGIRVTGNGTFSRGGWWESFTEYEGVVNQLVGKLRMIAVCTYSLEECRAEELLDVVSNHRFALIKRRGRWEIVESPEHKLTEQALRESERRFRRISELTSDYIFSLGLRPDGKLFLEWITGGFIGASGYSMEEIREQGSWRSIIYPDDFGGFKASILGALSGESFENEFRYYTKKGETRWILSHWQPERGEDGGVTGVIGAAKDITERKRMRKRLEETNERLKTLIHNIPDIIYFKDAEGTNLIVNRAFEEFAGLGENEIIGKKDNEIFPSGLASYCLESDRKVIEKGGPLRVEESYMGNDGERRFFDTKKAPLFDSEGRITGLIGVSRDITERKKQNDELEKRVRERTRELVRANEALKAEISERKRAESEREEMQAQLLQSQKTETIGKLAGGIAHDFNNLMTIIGSFSNLALKEGHSGRLNTYIEQIRAASERASGLTRQLLIFSRNQLIEPSLINLNSCIDEMLKMLYRLIGENVRIKKDLQQDLWTVRADKGNIEQLIMNLVVNAKDAMPHGGRITISTVNVSAEKAAHAACSRTGGSVRLTVADNGAGMDPGVSEHIFEPFFSTKGAGIGAGLGLAVVKNIVKEHGGEIRVESALGQGTAFEVYLPAETTSPALRPAGPEEAVERGMGERVLLVEDERMLRKSVALVLSKNGYSVFEAESAKEAIRLFEREGGRFDLVFSDMILRDSNGIELMDKLAAMSPVKVLFSSGYMDIESQWPVIKERGCRFLQKPYEIPELLKVIKDAVRG